MNNNFLGGRDIRKCSLLRNEGAAEGGARWWRLWGSPSVVARTVHVLLDYVHKVTVVQGRKKNEEYTIWPGGGVGPGNNRATDYVYSSGTLNKKTITYQYNGVRLSSLSLSSWVY